MIYIGADPGATGSIVSLDGNEITIIDYENLPQAIEELRTLEIMSCNRFAAIEEVHAMPMQGVSSTFKFGTNYGIWQGILMATNTPFELVRPQVWQKDMFDKKLYKTVKGVKRVDTKATSLDVARRLFPSVAASHLRLKKYDGRADALLIAEWLRRKHNGSKESK